MLVVPSENLVMINLYSILYASWIHFVTHIGEDFVWSSVLYEVFPMSFLMEQAGGQSFTGKQQVLS